MDEISPNHSPNALGLQVSFVQSVQELMSVIDQFRELSTGNLGLAKRLLSIKFCLTISAFPRLARFRVDALPILLRGMIGPLAFLLCRVVRPLAFLLCRVVRPLASLSGAR